jgi:putative transposase
MSRPLRNIFIGVPYHITQRGNDRQQVFHGDADYQIYLEFLWQYALRYGLEIWGYCLMPNHIHIIGVPQFETSLARTFGLGHMRYTQAVHRRDHRSGHLWQGRFFAAPLDEEHLSRAVRYVELNPVRAQLVATPEAWPWSSALTHLQGGRLPGAAYPPDDALEGWREYLAMEDSLDEIDTIRRRTITGRPIGNAAFITHLETIAGIPLNRERGRPKKEAGQVE